MRTLFIILVTMVVVGPLCFIAGGFFTGKRVVRDTNYAQLLWLTSIDRELETERYDRARRVSKSASDMTIRFLDMLENDPKLRMAMLMTAMGGFQMNELNDQIATRAKHHFLPISDDLSEESKRFLTSVVEVEISVPTSACAAPKNE